VKLRKPAPGPLYLELKDMLVTLDSLREEGLWSSRQSGGAPDIGLSAVVLWLTYDAHVKLGLKERADATLKRLKSELMLKLGEEVRALSDIHRPSTLETLQCAVTVLGLYRGEVDDLAKVLSKMLSDERKALEKITREYTPYEYSVPSLLVLVYLYLKRRGQIPEGLEEVLTSYLKSVTKSGEPDPSALYWLSEVLRELTNHEEYREHIKDKLMILEGVILGFTRELGKREEILEYLSLDRALWLYLAIDNLIGVGERLRLPILWELRDLSNRLIKQITAVGVVTWKESAYGRILRAERSKRFIEGVEPFEEERLDVDLATLSLLIGAYSKMGRHIVTYVTQYDLRELEMIEKGVFFLGVVFTALGGFALFFLLTSLIAIAFPGLVAVIPLQEVEIPILNVSVPPRYLILLVISLLFLGSGISVLYSLQSQEIKSLRDLLRAIGKPVKFIIKLISLLKRS